MKQKIILSPEEINIYNNYKQKIKDARTRQEINTYAEKAREIINIGKKRYVSSLESGVKIKNVSKYRRPHKRVVIAGNAFGKVQMTGFKGTRRAEASVVGSSVKREEK